MEDSLHVAVIGGGIIGLTVAIKFARRGARVTVVDRHRPGSGASAAANGALTPYSDHSAHPAVVKAASDSLKLYPEHLDFLRETTGGRVDCDQIGVLQVMLSDEDVMNAKNAFQGMIENSWPVEWLDQSRVYGAEPKICPDTVAGILYETEASIDIDQLMLCSIRALDRLGATLSFPTTVFEISQLPSGKVNLRTDAGDFDSDVAIVCTGEGPCTIDGIAMPRIRRIRGEILETWGPPGSLSRCVYWRDAFLTPKRDGRVLIGTTYVEHRNGMNEDTSSISVAGAYAQLRDALRVVPTIGSHEIRRVWKSWRPTTSDGLPVLGVCGSTSVFVANGFSGLGYTLAPFAAEYLSSMVLAGSRHCSVAEFSLDRPGLESVA